MRIQKDKKKVQRILIEIFIIEFLMASSLAHDPRWALNWLSHRHNKSCPDDTTTINSNITVFIVIGGIKIKICSSNETHDILAYNSMHHFFSKALDCHEPAEGNNIQPFLLLLIGWEQEHNLVHLSTLMTQPCSAGDVKRASYKSHCTPPRQTRLISIARSHRNVQGILYRRRSRS